MSQEIELLLLDVHGILLTAYWPKFLQELARQTGQDTEQVERRWRDQVRADAWSGRIDDAQIWERLVCGASAGVDWRGVLEAGYDYEAGASRLAGWSKRVPVWLLSNHRSHWLLPRLARFGLDGLFQRVLVSDQLGVAKPQPEVFAPVLDHVADPGAVLFVDDHMINLHTAEGLGLQTLLAEPGTAWPEQVDGRLGITQQVIRTPR